MYLYTLSQSSSPLVMLIKLHAMLKHIALFFFVLAGLTTLQAQRPITLENIWTEPIFSVKRVPGFNFLQDGKHYTRLEDNKIQQYDLTTGEFVQTIFDATIYAGQQRFPGTMTRYTFSADEQKILIETEREKLYRRSSKANFFVFDRTTSDIMTIFQEGKHGYAAFNPAADKVAFVYQNNLYYTDLKTGKSKQITNDGKINEIINGTTDWVYEEEFSIVDGFKWSPDGENIAFYRFDEREVPEFTMTNYKNGNYPEYITFKYPKVGEANSKVTIHLYNVEKDQVLDAAITRTEEFYVPRIKWTQDPKQLCVFVMNRHQNDLELLLVNADNGKSKRLLKETNKYYIDIHNNLTFLKNGKEFLWTSEMDGWNHIYLYDMNGKVIRQVTKGEWEVDAFYGLDEANRMVYFQGAGTSAIEREIYAASLDGGKKKTVVAEEGWNRAQFSSTFDYHVVEHATINTPPSFTVYNRQGKAIRIIEDNQDVRNRQTEYGAAPIEFFDFQTSEGVTLNGWMLKPSNFDPNKEYPLFMYLYGGPGSQQVTDNWKGNNYWWFQMLAQQGFIVACVDNRGTGGRGEEFKKMTYLQLGKYETIDQIEAAKYLGTQPYIAEDQIGIFGWSYGGYMSSLCVFKGNDVFKAGIAVAPVTNWKWYDSIYTERYMRTRKENEAGYEENSPVNFADRLQGAYLLVHGMGDDNVHFQNTAEMANALVDAGKQYDTYFYPNRAHGISDRKARLHLYRKMTDFLKENLAGKKIDPLVPRFKRKAFPGKKN